MIPSLAIILCCQLAGEILARLTGLPVPGPVIGMVLLLGLLLARQKAGSLLPQSVRDGQLESTATGLLAQLSLLFVPAGVGVIQRLDILGQYWFPLALALIVSSVLGIVVAAYVFRRIESWVQRGRR